MFIAERASPGIRDIYAKVMLDEIDESDQPDGDLFRKGDAGNTGAAGLVILVLDRSTRVRVSCTARLVASTAGRLDMCWFL